MITRRAMLGSAAASRLLWSAALAQAPTFPTEGREAVMAMQVGDIVSLDVAARSIRMEVDEAELAARRAAWTPGPRRYGRGYGALFSAHIQQANEGCDFDFLRTEFGAPVPEPAIY